LLRFTMLTLHSSLDFRKRSIENKVHTWKFYLEHPFQLKFTVHNTTPRAINSRGFHSSGAGEEIRTLDIHLGKVALYQLSYSRILYSFCVASRVLGVLETVIVPLVLLIFNCFSCLVFVSRDSLLTVSSKIKTPRIDLLFQNRRLKYHWRTHV
jgi:hypothetical protein